MLLTATTLSEPGVSWALGNAPFYLAIHADLHLETLTMYGMDTAPGLEPLVPPEGHICGYVEMPLPPVEEAPEAIAQMPRSAELAPWRVSLRSWYIERYGEQRYVTQHGLQGHMEAAQSWLLREMLGTTMPRGSWEAYMHLHVDIRKDA